MTGTVAKNNSYFMNSYYSMQADKELEAFGMATTLKPSHRLHLLALSRMNRWGHCPFLRGELRELLGVSPNTLKQAVHSLVSAKLIGPVEVATNPMCIVFSSRYARRADRSDVRCSDPDHAGKQELMWVHGFGWENKPGAWVETLNNPQPWIAAEVTRQRTTVTETETVRMIAPSW